MITLLTTTMLLSLLGTGAHGQCFSRNDRIAVPSAAEFSSIARFNLDLHEKLFPIEGFGNYVVSPYALWKSLSLAYFGSSGKTQQQLEKALGAPDKIAALKVWSYLDRLYENERNSTSGLRLDARVFLTERRTLRPCVEDILSGSVITQDFSNIYKASKNINNWVSGATDGHIASLYQPNNLIGARMVVASTGVHKGSWLHPFKSSASRLQPFYVTLENHYDVTTMTQKGYFNYGESAELGVQILEMPYAGGSVSMYVLLPPLNSGSVGLINTMKSLNARTLSRALGEMQHAEIRVVLPKFKFRYDVGVDLKEALERLGVEDLFNKDTADLTVFSPEGSLSVDSITHRAYVEVDEGGVNVASAKTFTHDFRPTGPLKHRVFVCNRPFLFIIMDKLASRILFIGAYRDPRE